ncbi:MAG: YggS family pyridoxal phosphate-dependent enzyme [Chitinophagaceae bacterium]|nr:YggS family pyridoxal phosphate-dependent enzyme [Chitinophagaceae bacterium]
MAADIVAYQSIQTYTVAKHVLLVAVSKTKPNSDIEALYAAGHRDFGENYVQELVDKQASLPEDIRWHFIGHLQSNKVKYIAAFVHLIHGIDSLKLLQEVNKQAIKANRVIDCLLQMHIAQEETKFGLDEGELNSILDQLHAFPHVRVRGLMGMASFTENQEQVKMEFAQLKQHFDSAKDRLASPEFDTLSMGMSGDYQLAIEQGSTLVRIGSLLFGARQYQ